jgi:hypothetical protein
MLVPVLAGSIQCSVATDPVGPSTTSATMRALSQWAERAIVRRDGTRLTPDMLQSPSTCLMSLSRCVARL